MLERGPITREARKSTERGTLQESVLPACLAPTTFTLPVYNRWEASDGGPGSTARLLGDIVTSCDREGIGDADFIILDDTHDPAQLAKREEVFSNVVAGITGTVRPRFFIIGHPQRAGLWEALEPRVSPRHRNIVRHMALASGYGGQRIRGAGAAYEEKVGGVVNGSSSAVAISLDDDLSTSGVMQANPELRRQQNGKGQLIYVTPRALARTDNPPESRKYIEPFLNMLGRSVYSLAEESDVPISRNINVTKDAALSRHMQEGEPTAFEITPQGDSRLPTSRDVWVAIGHKTGVPDINAGVLLSHLIASGTPQLDTRAVLAESAIDPFVVESTSHPDCGVMGMQRQELGRVPWLITNKELSTIVGSVFRVEDGLFTMDNVGPIGYVDSVWHHQRDVNGMRPGVTRDFLSELIGDAFRDIVIKRSVVDTSGRVRFAQFELASEPLSKDNIAGIYQVIKQKKAEIKSKIRALHEDTEMYPLERANRLASLGRLGDTLRTLFPDFPTSYRILDKEIRDQISFFSMVSEAYDEFLFVSSRLRQSGEFPALEFVR